ncbi:MAG TPA: universal stress protein [Actinomycetota bacterium]
MAAVPAPLVDNPTVEHATEVQSSGTESLEALTGKPVPEAAVEVAWRRDEAEAARRAQFRLYLGAAPGVGKTFAMLGEGRRRHSRGTDVVVGIVETYGRPKTQEALLGLEVLPPRRVEYRGSAFDELDAGALVARKPEVALIDELAHTNVPGSRRAKRWEDVIDVLAAGIAVISTVNVQHLESVNDVVANITGVRQQETVPDWVVDLADDLEIVDISPTALRRRMLHGNIYPDARKAELALERYFTMDNLTALRELALMRVANQVDDSLLARWSKDATPETRERVLVCVAYPTFTEDLVRRGARIAQRARGDLLVLHVRRPEERSPADWLEQVRTLTEALGGGFEVVEADSAVEGVLAYAYRQHVTQLVVGEPLRSKWSELVRGSFVNRLIRRAANIDVHVIARRVR